MNRVMPGLVLMALVGAAAGGCQSQSRSDWFDVEGNGPPVAGGAPRPAPEPATPAPPAKQPAEGQPAPVRPGGTQWLDEPPAPAEPAPELRPRRGGGERLRGANGPVTAGCRTVAAGGRDVPVQVIDVPLGSVTLKVALARDRVGCTEPLDAMARRHGAVAAINGSFFDAYSDRAARNPYGNLVVHGEVVHLSDRPTTIGIWADGTVAIGRVCFGISGSLDGSEHHPDNWYAYGINDFPEGSNWAEIYTPLYGLPMSPDGGQHVVVRSGEIAAVGSGPSAIPRDGYVLHLRGQETYLAGRMTPGRKCAFRVCVKSADPSLGWPSVQEALGCGPLLVREGKAAVDPAAEGFQDAKVLSGCCGRSALGLTAGGHLLLVTCPAATMRELGEVMQALGCKDAMNLDGGASSGLWLRGQYLTRPGRDVANALVVRVR